MADLANLHLRGGSDGLEASSGPASPSTGTSPLLELVAWDEDEVAMPCPDEAQAFISRALAILGLEDQKEWIMTLRVYKPSDQVHVWVHKTTHLWSHDNYDKSCSRSQIAGKLRHGWRIVPALAEKGSIVPARLHDHECPYIEAVQHCPRGSDLISLSKRTKSGSAVPEWLSIARKAFDAQVDSGRLEIPEPSSDYDQSQVCDDIYGDTWHDDNKYNLGCQESVPDEDRLNLNAALRSQAPVLSVPQMMGNFLPITSGPTVPTTAAHHLTATDIDNLITENRRLRELLLVREIACPICNSKFPSYETAIMKIHVQEHVTNFQAIVKCPFCEDDDWALMTMQGRRMHVLQHEADGLFKTMKKPEKRKVGIRAKEVDDMMNLVIGAGAALDVEKQNGSVVGGKRKRSARRTEEGDENEEPTTYSTTASKKRKTTPALSPPSSSSSSSRKKDVMTIRASKTSSADDEKDTSGLRRSQRTSTRKQ